MRKYLQFKKEFEAIEDIKKTLKTFEKISSAKIPSLKEKTKTLFSFLEKIEKVTSRLFQFFLPKNHWAINSSNEGKSLLLIFGADKGLCGDFHHLVINALLERKSFYDIFWIFGKKTEKFLKEEGIFAKESFSLEENLEEIFKKIIFLFKKKKFKRVDFLFLKYFSFFRREPCFLRFLPLSFEKKEGTGFPIFEPSPKEIFEFLLEEKLKATFLKVFLSSRLSEETLRVLTLEHSFKETEKILSKMMYNYFKQRRKEISLEQMESFLSHKIICQKKE